MGLFDFLKKKPEGPPAPAEPPATPFPATIATLSMDGVGTLALANGSTLRFGASACRGFMPAVGVAVTVTEAGAHPLGGFRAVAMTLASDEATYRARLDAQLASLPRPAPASRAPIVGGAAAAPPVPPPPSQPARLELPELDAPVPAGMRRVVEFRFENPRAPDVFFREVALDGCVVRVLAGRAPQATPDAPTEVFDRHGERHPSPEEARLAFESAVDQASRNFKSKTRRVRDLPVQPGLAKAAHNPSLETAFERARSADAAAVLADWLQGQGDPRGELAALFQRGSPELAKAFFTRNATALAGDLELALDDEVYDLRWEHGFLAGLSLKRRGYDGTTVLADLTRDVLALPLARFVTALRFGLASYESDNDWSDTLRAVVESPRGPHIRELRFDDFTSEDCELSWTAFGDFSPCWAKLPALEHLHLRSGEGGTLGDLVLPNLKTFIRESGGLGRAELESIVRAQWPRLERLDVWFGSDNYGAQGTVDLIAPLLDGEGLANLRHLGLVNCEFAADALRALVEAKVLPRLRVLDLSKGVLLDADVEVLLQHADRFRHLERLDLSENMLNESPARLKAALPNVVVDEQRFDDSDDGEYRYAAVGE